MEAAFADLKAKHFPLKIEFFSKATKELKHTIDVDGPGGVRIPGQDFFQEPVTVQITTGNGEVWEA